MGYKTTITTQHYATLLPQWFCEKYGNSYFISGTLVSSKTELKHYDGQFERDYQHALREAGFFDRIDQIHAVAMGENGYVTKMIITKYEIKYYWLGIENEQQEEYIWVQ